MIDITFLGQLVATLASTIAFAALIGVIGAAAYVLSTAAIAIERLPSKSAIVLQGQTNFPSTLGTIGGATSFVIALATLRAGGFIATFLFAFVLAALARSSILLASVLGARAGIRLAHRQANRRKALAEAASRKVAELGDAERKRLAGEDLSVEVANADAAVARLRDSLASLVATRDSVVEKLKAALEQGGNISLVADMVRMRDDMNVRIDLGQRVLGAAEMAVARLAYALPVKKLVRRRPAEIAGLDPRLPGDYAARVESAIVAIDSYTNAIEQARGEIDATAAKRGPFASSDGSDDFPTRARKEVDSIASAYKSVRDRAELLRLALQAREGMANVATAAGEVSATAREVFVDEREVGLLLDDLARANQTTTDDFIGGDEHVKALAKALAQGAKALSGGDRASLGEVVEALQSMG